MKRKIFITAVIAMLVTGVYANQLEKNNQKSDNLLMAEADTLVTEADESASKAKSPISYKVYKPKYSYDYSIDFYNNTGQTLEVEYIYASPMGRDGWITNYVRISGGGKNRNNAAGPYGKVEIIDVYRP